MVLVEGFLGSLKDFFFKKGLSLAGVVLVEGFLRSLMDSYGFLSLTGS